MVCEGARVGDASPLAAVRDPGVSWDVTATIATTTPITTTSAVTPIVIHSTGRERLPSFLGGGFSALGCFAGGLEGGSAGGGVFATTGAEGGVLATAGAGGGVFATAGAGVFATTGAGGGVLATAGARGGVLATAGAGGGVFTTTGAGGGTAGCAAGVRSGVAVSGLGNGVTRVAAGAAVARAGTDGDKARTASCACRNASITSTIEAWRSSGRLASALRSIGIRGAGMGAARGPSSGGGWWMCLSAVAMGVVPRNGTSPVYSSKTTMPKA